MPRYLLRLHLMYDVFLIFLAIPGLLYAQQPSGVVTAVQGQAQVLRPASTGPTALRVKDGVIIRDVIDTREKSLARILFGGKATVTIRELSRFEVHEENLPGGATRSTIELESGAILVNVARQLMRPGDEVQIRTPNAVAAVKGSTLLVEAQGVFTQLFGSSTLSCMAPATCADVLLPENHFADVLGTGASARIQPPMAIPPGHAIAILQSMRTGRAVTAEANAARIIQDAANEIAALGAAATVLVGGQPTAGLNQLEIPRQPQITPTQHCDTAACIPPPPPQSPPPALPVNGCGSAGNVIKNCSFEITGSIPEWDRSGAASIITDMRASDGTIHFKPTDGDRMAILSTGSGSVGNSTSKLRQGTSLLQAGKVYHITFDYNFMSNEFPTQATTFNDIFQANAIGSDGKSINIVTESRNSSAFKTDKPSITSAGANYADFSFTLNEGNGYTDWKTGSKTIIPASNIGTLEFSIRDVGDTGVDSAVLIDKVTVELDPPLYVLADGQSLTRPAQKALVEYSNQSATFDSLLVASGSGANGAPSVNLNGSLLKATSSNLNVPYSLLGLTNGSRLFSTSDDGLVDLQGGNYFLSTLKGTAIFDFWGTATTVDSKTGVDVGSGPTITHGGPLLQASDGATINTQKLLKLDTALLDATLPVIRLLGSANAHTSLTTETGTLDLIKSKITSVGPIIALDKALITVNNGPLINLSSGSQLIALGDLLSLTNGSKINVVNGPLISVTGTGSLLDVSGALVHFGGTGGNKIIVNNGTAPTATLSGLPVSATSGGTITIGPHPVKNPSLGTIQATGSLIQASNGGTVNITANAASGSGASLAAQQPVLKVK
jgi:FecR protein